MAFLIKKKVLFKEKKLTWPETVGSILQKAMTKMKGVLYFSFCALKGKREVNIFYVNSLNRIIFISKIEIIKC